MNLNMLEIQGKKGFPGGVTCQKKKKKNRRQKRHGFNSWAGKILWKRAWQTTPVFLAGRIPWKEETGGLTVHSVTKSWTWLKSLSMQGKQKKTHIHMSCRGSVYVGLGTLVPYFFPVVPLMSCSAQADSSIQQIFCSQGPHGRPQNQGAFLELLAACYQSFWNSFISRL